MLALILVFLLSGAVSAYDLSDALDTSLSFTTGGNADWFGQYTMSYYDGDAAQSASISHDEESWMRTTVSGPTAVSFYWKVSSERFCDFLGFYIDGSLQDSIDGSVDWQQMMYTLPSGSHVLKWRYIKDGSISSGNDCGWVDHIEWGDDPEPPPLSCDLSEALDTSLSFTTGGSVDWFCQSMTFYYDGDAAQSGSISGSQESWMQTTVSGPTTVSFYWTVFSEFQYDFLEFYIDDSLQDSITGSVDFGPLDWQQMTYTLGSGSHTLKWRYVKDMVDDAGLDCGWVDRVELGTDPQQPPPSCDLSEALDTSLSFTAGGSADWFCQSETSCYDADAAQSGGISHTQESWMQTTVSGPTTLSFYWKVSSEGGYDYLEFYIDDLLQDSISGPVDWQQIMYTLPSGSHTLKWRYAKDGSISSGSDCGWVDHVELGTEPEPPPSPGDLSEALDTSLSFTTGGIADWFSQNATSYYGGDAAQSGDITDNQESWMQTTLSGPTTLSFYWKISSEGGYDSLEFYIDGLLQDSISGSVDWQQMIYTLSSGSHTLVWRYVKDGSVSSGSDCGWVDRVELGTDPEPPPSPGDFSEALDTTLSFTTGGSTEWFCQSETSYYDGDAVQSGDILDTQESWIRTAVGEAGTVSFYWKVSSEYYCDFLEFYINGLLQDRISGSVDWQQMTYTLTSGSHALEWRYVKDYSMRYGSDCGWVDHVEWVTGSQPPTPPPSCDLSEAMDTTLSFTKGGSADWFCQATSYYDGDAAQSGDISHNQLSWMETTVSGPTTVSFYWKVSSESGYDLLQFYINHELQDSISGSVDWQQMMYTLPSGSHTLFWRYVKDGSASSGSDCGWVDKVESGTGPEQPPPSCDLSEALDTTLSFTTEGGADWFCQGISYYDGDAAQSGYISDNQESWMRTTVSGPTTVSFYWKVSSEVGFDFLEFYINGQFIRQISGLVDWQPMIYTVPSSSITLEWRYVKDGSASSDGDCGWVDKLELGVEQPQPPSGDLSEALDTTLSFITGGGGSMDWFGQYTTTYDGEDAAQSAPITDDEESWMKTTVSGAGTFSFYWKVSSEEDCDFLEFYIDEVLQSWISGSVDWQQMTYTLDSGSHTLEWIYVKDISDIVDSDCGWVDQVEWVTEQAPPSSCDLSEGLDTSLSVTTGGSVDWFCQETMFYNDGDAAQSGDISFNQESWMQTLVSGPATVSFYWKVSSESDYDYLEFYIDGSLQHRISGSVDWHRMMNTLSSGAHTLEWRYVKDESVSLGSDCGWVDFVEVN